MVAAQGALRRLGSHGIARSSAGTCSAHRNSFVNTAYSIRFIGSTTRPTLQPNTNAKKTDHATAKSPQTSSSASNPTSSSVLSSISKAFAGGSSSSTSRPAWMQAKPASEPKQKPAQANPSKVVVASTPPTAPRFSTAVTHTTTTARPGHSNVAYRSAAVAPQVSPQPIASAQSTPNVAPKPSMSSAVDAFKR
jgi:hypothetical protein